MSYNTMSKENKIAFMDNDLSFNPKLLTNIYNFPDNREKSLIVKSSEDPKAPTDRFIDLFPFKLVTLEFLQSLDLVEEVPGKLQSVVNYYSFFRFNFNSDSRYLPMGDLIILKPKASGKIVLVLLVRNEEPYSTPILKSDFEGTWVDDGNSCGDGLKITWYTSKFWEKDKTYKNNYLETGMMVSIGNENANPYKDRGEGSIVAVNKDYVYKVNSDKADNEYHFDPRWSLGYDGGSGCKFDKYLMATSYFNTFNLQTKRWGRWTNFNYFFDFIPDSFKASCCVNLEEPGQYQTLGICNPLSNTTFLSKEVCDPFMFGGDSNSTSYSNNFTKYSKTNYRNPTKYVIGSNEEEDSGYCKGDLVKYNVCFEYATKVSPENNRKIYEERVGKFCESDEKLIDDSKLGGLCYCFSKPEQIKSKFEEVLLKKKRDGSYEIKFAEEIMGILEDDGVFENLPECWNFQCTTNPFTFQHNLGSEEDKENKCDNAYNSELMNCIFEGTYGETGGFVKSELEACYRKVVPETTPPPPGTTTTPSPTPKPTLKPKNNLNIPSITSDSTTDSTTESPESDNTYLYIGIGVFILIVIISIGAYFLLKKPDQPMMMQQPMMQQPMMQQQPMMIPQQKIKSNLIGKR